jgi:hypothetical protein
MKPARHGPSKRKQVDFGNPLLTFVERGLDRILKYNDRLWCAVDANTLILTTPLPYPCIYHSEFQHYQSGKHIFCFHYQRMQKRTTEVIRLQVITGCSPAIMYVLNGLVRLVQLHHL